MGGTESSEVSKKDARLQRNAQQQDKKKPRVSKKQAEKGNDSSRTGISTAKDDSMIKVSTAKDGAKTTVSTAKDGAKSTVSTAKDGTTTSITTSADQCTVTTVITRPDGSSETTTEIVTTTEKELDATHKRQQQLQALSPTAVAASRAVADFESVSEESTTAQILAQLAWHAWSASATAAAMGVTESTAEKLRNLSDNTGVLFTSTVVARKTPQGDLTDREAGGEWKKEDVIKLVPAFVNYVTSHGTRYDSVTAVELFILARAFCRFHVLKYNVNDEKDKHKSLAERTLAVAGRRSKERKLAWELARAFTLYYPEFPIHRRGLRFSKTNAVLMDEAHVESESSFEFISIMRHLSIWLQKFIVISLLRDASEDCTCSNNVIVLHNGEVVRNGSWKAMISYLQDLRVLCPQPNEVAMCLSSKNATAALFDSHAEKVAPTRFIRLADEVVLVSGSPIVDTSSNRNLLMQVGSFGNKQAKAYLEKPVEGCHIYEAHTATAPTKSADDSERFDAGDWLMSWLKNQSHGPPLTTKAAARKLANNWTAIKPQKIACKKPKRTEVFRSKKPDGSIVTKTVRTTTRTETSPTGELVTTIEVETTTETETKDGATSTSVETETTTETTTTETVRDTAVATTDVASTAGMTAISSTEEDGVMPGETVKIEVFRSEKPDGSIVTKTVRTTTRTETSPTGELVTTIETVRTTTRTETSPTGELVTTIEVETTTETETKDGATSTSVETETTTETVRDTAVATTDVASTVGTTAISSTEEDGVMPGETVKTEVFRSEKPDSSIVTKTVRTTTRTETSPTGELVTTIGVETTTETGFTNATMNDFSMTRDATSTMNKPAIVSTENDGSMLGETVKTEVFLSENPDGSIVTKTVRTTFRTIMSLSGELVTTIDVDTTVDETEETLEQTDTTTETKTLADEKSTTVETETSEEYEQATIPIVSVIGIDRSKDSVAAKYWEERAALTTARRTGEDSAWLKMKRRRLVKTWLPQFVSYVQRRGRSLSKTMPRKELLNFARDFCDQNFVSFEDGFFNVGTYEEKRATWTIARSLSFHYPGVAVQQLGLGVGKFQRTLLIDEVCRTRPGLDGAPLVDVEFVLSALQVVPKKCAYYEDVLILENGEVLFHGTGESLITYFQELGFVCAPGLQVSNYLLNLTEEQQAYHQVTMIQGFNNQRQLRRSRMFSGLMKFADDMTLITGAPGAGGPSRTSTPASSPARSSGTSRLSMAYSPPRRQLTHRFAPKSPLKSPIPSAAAFASPHSSKSTTRGMKITAFSSQDAENMTAFTTASAPSTASPRCTTATSSPAAKSSRRNKRQGDSTLQTTPTASPYGTKRGSKLQSSTPK
ncbi:hypothetical protein PsorP6_011656 [Peronosclerospora sorghi]|uniref:Uncharacterized protein n=1 Tax=Peronosclerospora sorghi TaxID=230839 RepID=A0ACC0WJK9_9STRA|nr:hypothetical protein PsorP6_011656 [Peronosclerospora sorghi]